MIIALIVLSLILLTLILGLIFKSDFREDVLKAENENQAEFKGIKIKGALFWVIYALTAIGTIYLALQYNQVADVQCDPILKADGATHWMALDTDNGNPIILKYGCDNSLKTDDNTGKSINVPLLVDGDLHIKGPDSAPVIGSLDRQSLLDLDLTNDFKIEEYLEIYYKLELQPFSSVKSSSDFYDWNGYENLPFTVSVNFSTSRQVYVLVKSKSVPADFQEQYLSLEKWDEHLKIGQNHYIIRLRSRDLNTENDIDEHVNFQIFKFSGQIQRRGS